MLPEPLNTSVWKCTVLNDQTAEHTDLATKYRSQNTSTNVPRLVPNPFVVIELQRL